jgi:spermidine synthase
MKNDRKIIFAFYAAGLAAYSGDRDQWSTAIQRVLDRDADNPYYRWVAGN